MEIRLNGILRFATLNRFAKNVAQASSPAGSPGVPPGVGAGDGTPPQLAAETDCATRFLGRRHHQRTFAVFLPSSKRAMSRQFVDI